MLNLAEIYWEWRNRPPKPKTTFKTSMGYTVKKFDSLWAVKSGNLGKYIDMKGGWSWEPSDSYFRDCLTTQAKLEQQFGKILGLEEVVEETTK